MSTCLTPGPTHPDRWPTSETSAAPSVSAATATVAPTLKAELARRSGRRGGRRNPGRGGGGVGGGGAGDKERLHSMAYNNAYVEGGQPRGRLSTRVAGRYELPGVPVLHIPLMWNTGQALQLVSTGDARR